MKKSFFLLKCISAYSCVCILENFLWKIHLITNYEVEKYSLIEIVFFCVILLMSTFFTTILLKSDKLIDYTKKVFTLLAVYLFLSKVVNLRLIISILFKTESSVLGVNFLSQDIWICYYIGSFLGMIFEGFKNRRKNCY